jgi:hypothetical protein
MAVDQENPRSPDSLDSKPQILNNDKSLDY